MEEKEIKQNEAKNENVTDNITKTKKSKKILIIILAILLIASIAITVYFLFFSVKTIDVSKYIKLEFEGYNGYATATAEFDKKLKDEFKDSSIYKKFNKKAKLEITSNNYDLKNGDTIKVKINISNSWLEKNKLKLEDKTVKVKISGIPEAESIDVFEDIEVSVEGISPYLSVSVTNNSSNDFIDTIYYSLSESYNLANGDKIKITAMYSEYDAQNMGYIVEKDTMNYTIKDQPYYATSKKDITEKIIETISSDMINEIKENIDYAKSSVYSHYLETYNPTNGYSDDLVAGEPTLVNLYLLPANSSDGYYSIDNYIYGIFKVTYTSQETNNTFDWYFATYTTDIAVTNDGKLYEEEYDNYYYYSNYSGGQTIESIYNACIEPLKSKYTVEIIK